MLTLPMSWSPQHPEASPAGRQPPSLLTLKVLQVGGANGFGWHLNYFIYLAGFLTPSSIRPSPFYHKSMRLADGWLCPLLSHIAICLSNSYNILRLWREGKLKVSKNIARNGTLLVQKSILLTEKHKSWFYFFHESLVG